MIRDIGELEAHLVISTKKGEDVHVVPESVLQRIADGSLPITELQDWEHIIPVIVKEWLGKVKDGKDDH